jgi:hypothetical protein
MPPTGPEERRYVTLTNEGTITKNGRRRGFAYSMAFWIIFYRNTGE